jgi:hypothetical protein
MRMQQSRTKVPKVDSAQPVAPGLQPYHQYFSFDITMCLQGLWIYALFRTTPTCSTRWAIGLVGRSNAAGDRQFLVMADAETGECSWRRRVLQDRGCLHAGMPSGCQAGPRRRRRRCATAGAI